MNSVNEKRIEGIMEKGDYKMNREYYENLLDDDFRIVAIDVFEDNDLMPTGFKWNDNLQLLISDNDYDMDNDKYKIAIEVQEVTLSNEKKYIILRFMFGIIEDGRFRIRHMWTTMTKHDNEWEELIYSSDAELIDYVCEDNEKNDRYHKYF